MTGTTTGFLRLGDRILKSATLAASHRRQKAQMDVDLGYLLSEQSDVNFDYFRLDETLRPDNPFSGSYKETWKNKAASLACGLFCILWLHATIVGIVTIGRWFFK